MSVKISDNAALEDTSGLSGISKVEGAGVSQSLLQHIDEEGKRVLIGAPITNEDLF